MPTVPNQSNKDIRKNIYHANSFQSNSPPTPTPSPPESVHLTLLSSSNNMSTPHFTDEKTIFCANSTYELLRCNGCKNHIEDKYVLNLMNSYWHEACLTCSYCGKYLQNSCYHKNMQLYCKDDYLKLFGVRCSSCNESLHSNDLVMRTTFGKIFHLNCFKCNICETHLKKGDEYLINEDTIYCKYDYELLHGKNHGFLPLSLSKQKQDALMQSLSENETKNNNTASSQLIKNHLINNSNSSFNSNQSDEDDSLDEDCDNRRTSKRPRTILTSSQRRKFRDAFGVSQKPCRKVREQLASETGLSVRVVQVWFQNERAKMKKLQRRQQQPNTTNGQIELNDDKSRHSRHKSKNKNINHDDDDINDEDTETCSEDETENLSNGNSNKLRANRANIMNKMSPSDSSSIVTNPHVQQSRQSFLINNCDQAETVNNVDIALRHQNHQEILNYSENYYNKNEPDCSRLLSLCDYNSNGNSGPSSSSSTSSIISSALSSSFCSSRIDNLSYFEGALPENGEKNPIDCLQTMHTSYFCSKC